MKKLKLVAAAMVLVAVVGCATSPFIDESLQEFDAHPMASLLGTVKPMPPTIAPLGREHLVGLWVSTIKSATRMSGGDELKKNYAELWQMTYGPRMLDEAETYDFRSDGSYVYQHMTFPQKIAKKSALGNYPQHCGEKHVNEGAWSYDNGTLVLRPRKLISSYYNDDKPICAPRTMDINGESLSMQVYWISDHEYRLIKPASDTILADYLKKQYGRDSRQTRSYDDFGRETERLIYIDGSYEGRETGMITETVRAPAFFKKEEK